MFSIRFAFLGLLLPPALAAQVVPSRWLAMDDTTQAQAMWLDYQTLADTPAGVSAWVKSKAYPGEDTLANGKRYATKLTHYVIDCKAKTFAFAGYAYYDKAGNGLVSYEYPSYTVTQQTPIPDSIGEFIVINVCAVDEARRTDK